MTSRAPSLAVVVVHFRRSDLLEACLDSLRASTRQPNHVVVVENAAVPGSDVTPLLQGLPDATLIANPDNRGYAAACNQGWRATHTDLVLFLNADVVLAPDTIAACVAAMAADPRIGVTTPRLLRPDGRLDHACHRGLPTPMSAAAYKLRLHRFLPRSRRLSRYTMSWLDPLTDHDVEACSGAFALIRRDALEAVGGWDEGYWFYAEDLDLCLRMRDAGFRVRYLGTVRALHVKGAASNLDVPDEELDADGRAIKRRVQRAIADSHLRFYRQHLRSRTPAPVRWLVDLQLQVEWRLSRSRS